MRQLSSITIIRARFFRSVFIIFLLIVLKNNALQAQDDLNVIKDWIQFSDAPNSLYHYLAGQAYQLLDERTNKIASLKTPEEWQQRQQWIHKTLLATVGPFPEKTPLNPQHIRTVYKNGYKVEHIVYESQPGFYVTSSLFIPALKKGVKAPAVIYCSGHSDDGYRNPVYQHVILNLVKKGFIVFAFDPVGQGERLEYNDPQTGQSVIGARDQEHGYVGAQAFITGSSLARYMIWDGIRAVDYLLGRMEVDTGRIGITGRSGGGTQTAYIAAFDNRIKVAATENYITNYTRLIESAGPQDGEQNFYHGIKRGLDMADLLLVRAPKPAIMITTTRDQDFNIGGAIETAKEVSRIYDAYGSGSNFTMVTDDAPHASTKKNRETLYSFFQKYLDNPGDPKDEDVQLLTPEELQVCKTGQVITAYGSETIFCLNKKAAEKSERKPVTSENNLPAYFLNVIQSAKKLSGYQPPASIDKPVFTGRFQKEGYVIEKYFIKGEGNYVIPYLLLKPDQPNHKALIYLDPSGKSAEAAPGGDMEWFVRKGFMVLAPDLLGTGEMGPGDFHGDSYIKGVSYNIWFLSLLIGRSIVGVQASDLVKLVNLLKEKDIKEVYGLAIGEMSPILLHAAAFDSAINRVALINPYSSYRSLALNHFYNPAYIQSTVPGALPAYDLPDLAGSLAPRKLMMAGIRDGAGKIADSDSTHVGLAIIKAAYDLKNADKKLSILPAAGSIKDDFYNAWIQ